MDTQVWEIRLIVETDDEAEVERIGTGAAQLACPHPGDSAHRCAVPWMLMTTQLDDEQAAFWRDDLNR